MLLPTHSCWWRPLFLIFIIIKKFVHWLLGRRSFFGLLLRGTLDDWSLLASRSYGRAFINISFVFIVVESYCFICLMRIILGSCRSLSMVSAGIIIHVRLWGSLGCFALHHVLMWLRLHWIKSWLLSFWGCSCWLGWHLMWNIQARLRHFELWLNWLTLVASWLIILGLHEASRHCLLLWWVAYRLGFTSRWAAHMTDLIRNLTGWCHRIIRIAWVWLSRIAHGIECALIVIFILVNETFWSVWWPIIVVAWRVRLLLVDYIAWWLVLSPMPLANSTARRRIISLIHHL